MSEPKKEETSPDLKKTIKNLMAKMQRGAELQKELSAIEAELKKYGMSLEVNTKKTRKAKGTGTRTPIEEAAVVKVLDGKELGYADIAKGLCKNPQTVKKWLDANNKKFSKRSEDPKNPRSKVFYKAK